MTVMHLGRIHPDQAHVAAERYPLEPVLGLAAFDRPHLGPESGEELGDLDEDLGRDKMATLVQQNRKDDEGEEEDPRQHLDQYGHWPRPRAHSSAARRRPHESAASTASRLRASSPM